MSDKKYHLKITENETGRAVHDVDTSCIIGVFARDLADVSGIAVVGGMSTAEYCLGLLSLETCIENIYREYPELREGVRVLKSAFDVGIVDMSTIAKMLRGQENEQ